MFGKIGTFLCSILYENNEPSLTRLIVAVAFVTFIIGTVVDIIMALYGFNWQSYPTFATITGGGSISAKFGDRVVTKVVDSVWNSPPGHAPVTRKNPAASGSD